MSAFSQSSVIAVLGPTNTGKTHLAVERLCAHSSGMIGFPLRLLAREVYDRVVALKGANRVALVTGEEKIIPPDARWFLCTAEAMPIDRDFSFVAIDEAQLGINPERGHIFTDRMLNIRGRDETMILGSDSLRPLVEQLIPEAEIISRPRFSTLSYAGPRKLSRLPRRSAIVAFSVEDVYAIAEMLRRQHGGAAIVMGSLSPQTRNAQVKMYQDGEVDYLVATDAIGMGLNLDVSHVAFASLKKFDGRRRRRLTLAEIGQIAGRAGRHQKDGSFGVLSGLASSDELEPEEIERLEDHAFPRLEWLYWRNAEPDLASVTSLIQSLEDKPKDRLLQAAPEAIDLAVLKRLAEDPSVSRLATGPDKVGLLWEAACIPDFRKVGADHQARFVASLWPYLAQGNGRIPHARMAQEIARLENVQGDISTLAARISAARNWSYIAQKSRWVEQADMMVERTRWLERRLSDAMHMQLTQRFVDKRTRVLMRGLLKGALPQDIALETDGAVLVDGLEIGTLKGFQFIVPSDSRREDRKMLLAAAERYLGPIMTDKADALAKAPDSDLKLAADESGQPVIYWQDAKLAVLSKGKNLLNPETKFDHALKDLSPENSKKAEARVKQWVETMKAKHLEGLVKIDGLANDANTPASVRALFAQIVEAGGIIARRQIDQAVRALDNDMRGVARRGGLVFGALDIFHHALMKPGAVLWRTALFAALDEQPMIALPGDNAVHLKEWKFAAPDHASRLGFRKIGPEYVRVDMAERLVKQAHEARQAGPVFAVDPALATSLGLSTDVHDALLDMAGFETTDDLPQTVESSVTDEPEVAATPAAESATEKANTETAEPSTPDDSPQAEAPVKYWRWKGMGKARSGKPPKVGGKKSHGKRPKKSGSAQRKSEPVLATAGGAFAELAALKEAMKK
ncbi:helicase-related protein [Parasphingorhabdus litoris]|uniref:Helicase-related protein n=1 Tax=Parasphingorhabdus litoris TaxID=394733 RepID=A0ABN1AWV4_9SPHN|nr:helicase-related protein [Parasphingorhabdus litoris]